MTNEQSPKPPTNHSSRYYPKIITSQDSLGLRLLRQESFGIDAEFRVSDGMLEQEYWQDMQEFYSIDDTDAEMKPLEVIADNYCFSKEGRDHILRGNIGSQALNTAFDYAVIKSASEQPSRYKKDLELDISAVRDLLLKTFTDPEAQRYLSIDLDEYAEVPPIFNQWRSQGEGLPPIPWHDWLSHKASTEQFMNFIQWHNFRMYHVNTDPEIEAVIAIEKQEYRDILEKFVEQGVISMRDSTLEDLDHVGVIVADVFSTSIRGWSGYYPIQPNRLLRYVAVNEHSIETATKHELNHAVLGEFEDRWLNEAVTEHINVAMQNGEMHDTNELIDLGVYVEERRLLKVVMRFGNERISLRTLLDGYTEQKNDQSLDIFSKAVDLAWGVDALEKIQLALQDHEHILISDGVSERDAQEIALEIVRSDLLQQPEIIFGSKPVIKDKVKA